MHESHTQSPVRVDSSRSIISFTPSLKRRIWFILGLMAALLVINVLAEGNDTWLWGAGTAAGALAGLVYAMVARQSITGRQNTLAVEILIWVAAAVLGIVLISAIPSKILFTLLKVAILTLLVTRRRRNADSR